MAGVGLWLCQPNSEGFMTLLVYLPATFGMRFQPYLPKIISPILSRFADGEKHVRDTAMHAGRMIVVNYSTNWAIDLLLPELEQGMFDTGWCIRVSFPVDFTCIHAHKYSI